MSITHELRKWAEEFWEFAYSKFGDQSELLAIADRIDAEYQKAITSVMNDALYHANESDMAELGWVRLPKDADGETIHIGDVMCWLDEDVPNKVDCMHLCGDGWWVYAHGVGVRSKELRHYHAPTVEDVLEEFYRTAKADSDANWGDLYETIAEYAKRLKLAGEDE